MRWDYPPLDLVFPGLGKYTPTTPTTPTTTTTTTTIMIIKRHLTEYWMESLFSSLFVLANFMAILFCEC